jgi:hypothetical protein
MEESIVQNQMIFAMYQAGLKGAADMMSATLDTTRRLQQQQFDAVHSAIEAQAKSLGELCEVKSVDELLAVQMRLAGKQVERTMEFWGGMWRIAGEGPFRQSMHDATVLTSTSLASALREAAQNEQQGEERKSA